jgi:hypothetical protein
MTDGEKDQKPDDESLSGLSRRAFVALSGVCWARAPTPAAKLDARTKLVVFNASQWFFIFIGPDAQSFSSVYSSKSSLTRDFLGPLCHVLFICHNYSCEPGQSDGALDQGN